MPHRPSHTRRAFSLFEVVTVISIISLIAGVSLPALNGTSRGRNVQTGARLVAGWLNVARSEAIARHTLVRFALVRDWPGKVDANLRKVSLWAWDADLEGFSQITGWQELPAGIILEPTLPEYLRTAAYAVADPSATHGDCVLAPEFASTAKFDAGTWDQSIEARFVEFTAAGNARVPGSSERQAVFVLTPGSLNADGEIVYGSHANGHASDWAQISLDKLTGRVRVSQP